MTTGLCNERDYSIVKKGVKRAMILDKGHSGTTRINDLGGGDGSSDGRSCLLRLSNAGGDGSGNGSSDGGSCLLRLSDGGGDGGSDSGR